MRPWVRPCNATNATGRITLPLRHSSTPSRGVNVLLLWREAIDKGFSAPIWMTYRQAVTLNSEVRKGEHGSLVVFADRFTRTDTNVAGTETEREIPFMKGYTVFNVEKIDGLPAHYYAKPDVPAEPVVRIEARPAFGTC